MRIEEREREETFESTIGRRHCLIDIGEEKRKRQKDILQRRRWSERDITE